MIGYFDCYSGISGDMVLGALVDAGMPIERLIEELRRLPVDGFRLEAATISSHDIRGTRVTVHTEHDRNHNHDHYLHRNLPEIERIIRQSSLLESIKSRSLAIFRCLGEAEAIVHGCPIEEVHFHEVGALDTIVDVVGSVIGLDYLKLDAIFASPLPLGSGTVTCAHGVLPVPAPAVLEICRRAGAPVTPCDVKAELVTPTGAAILATLASFEHPLLKLRRLGYGYGVKELPWPNAVRLWVGEQVTDGAEEDVISVIESNIDDMSPELLGATMDTLLQEGALDVTFQPIQMKKNRPAVQVSILAHPTDVSKLSTLFLEQTTSLGVRIQEMRRVKCKRWHTSVETPWGTVRVKFKSIGDHRSGAPEYEDCLRLARNAGVGLSDVYAAAMAEVKASE